MNALHIAGRCALTVVLAVLVAGCSQSATGSSSSSPETSASEVDTTPPAESTGAESPQPPQNGGPAISVASLPIGGSPEFQGAQQCVTVSWLAPTPIPHDVVVSLDAIGLNPEGIFRLGGDLCAADLPICTTSWTWTWNTADVQCLVRVTQMIDSEETVQLVLAGTAHCATQSLCDGFVRGFKGGTIEFQARSGVVSSSSESSESGTGSGESSSSADESSAGSSDSSAGS